MPGKSRETLIEIRISAPVELVWRAVRDPELIGTWFGWDAETLKDEIEFIFVAHATEEPGHGLQFGEWEGSAYRFQLTPEGEATRFRIDYEGNAPLAWREAYDDIAEGWVTFAHQLQLALERHPGESRRTIFLSGAARPGVGDPSAALGLDRRLPEGMEYSAMLTSGDHVSGTVGHKTAFQTGFHVEQWGHGLLVVTDKGVGEKRPHGGGSVVVTTYGLSDAAFSDLEARWKRWWTERFE